MPGYRLSGLAAADLKAIYKYSERTFGRARAVGYVKGLEAKLDLLGIRPALGQARPDIATGVRSFPHVSHIIYYERSASESREAPVYVLRILHGAQDPARHLHQG
jgi:toxin ParE1/3/4